MRGRGSGMAGAIAHRIVVHDRHDGSSLLCATPPWVSGAWALLERVNE